MKITSGFGRLNRLVEGIAIAADEAQRALKAIAT